MNHSMTNKELRSAPAFKVGETADYIATLSKELAALARGQRLDFLAYLLEMAATEASQPTQNISIKLPNKALTAKKTYRKASIQ